MEQKVKAHVGLCIVVTIWGLDYVMVKEALTILEPMGLLFCKYFIGFLVMMCIRIFTSNKNKPSLKDIPKFILCSLFGEILYFSCEYTAMDYMPISLITVMLAFVPIFAILIEWVIYHRKPSTSVIAGIIICVIGIALIIGVDIDEILKGRFVGYLLCFGAIISWNIYNFITASLRKYDAVTLTGTQMICTMCIILPTVIHSFPAPEEFTPQIIGGLLWLGIVDAGFGFLLMVFGLKVLGPAISAVYSNFMPVTATFFSFVLLHERIGILQIVGGIMVVTAGFYVICQKEKTAMPRLE